MRLIINLLNKICKVPYSEPYRCRECVYFTRIRVTSTCIYAGKCHITHYTRAYCKLWKKEYSGEKFACSRFRKK